MLSTSGVILLQGTKEEDIEGGNGGILAGGCDSLLKDQNISLLYHGLSYTQNIKR